MLLYAVGLEVPGGVVTEALREPQRAPKAARAAEAPPPVPSAGPSDAAGYTEDDEETIRQRLDELGYL
jgi:hypothetical protein